MVLYELIKEYPGSPELGAIAIPNTTDENCDRFCILESVSEMVSPKDYPEFLRFKKIAKSKL